MSRKQATQCDRCGGDRHRGRCKKAADAPPRGQQSSEPAGAAALQVPATFGFRASAIDKMLRIEQDSSPDETGMVTTHQVDLSIHEARQLLQWIESQVDSEAE